MAISLRSLRPRNSFGWMLTILLPLKVACAVAFAMAIGEPHWIPEWLITATGSALIVAGCVWLIDIVASSYTRRQAAALRVVACAVMAPAWLFAALASGLVASHPVYLIFIFIVSCIGTGVGIALGLVVASIMPAGERPREPFLR